MRVVQSSGDRGIAATSGTVRWRRMPRLFATAGIVGISLALFIFSVRGIGLEDTAAYWAAAERLREGQQLYPLLAHPELAQFSATTYVYSPWFAFAWLPLT